MANGAREDSVMTFVSVAGNESLSLEERMSLLERHLDDLDAKHEKARRELACIRKKLSDRRHHRKTLDLTDP